jgi:hypothetical protein
MVIQNREAALRQTTLQRHLTALKAYFMKAASARALTFVTATSGFT